MAFSQEAVAGFSAEKAVDLSSRKVQERLSISAIPAFFSFLRPGICATTTPGNFWVVSRTACSTN